MRKILAPKIIFQTANDGRYTKEALLYQDIIHYPYMVRNAKYKFWDIGTWLISNNKEFRDDYDRDFEYSSKKNTTIRYAVMKREDRIKSKIKDLVHLGLIYEAEKTKASKVDTLIPLYSPTGEAYFIHLLLERQKPAKKEAANDRLYDLIQSNLGRFDFPRASTLSKIYERIKDRGLLDEIMNILESVLRTEDKTQTVFECIIKTGALVYEYGLANKSLFKEYDKINKHVINNLDEEARIRFYFSLKLDTERQIALQYPSREWISLMMENIADYSALVLYGSCKRCKEEYPVLVDGPEYWLGGGSISDCSRCNGKKTLTVSDKISGRPIRLTV